MNERNNNRLKIYNAISSTMYILAIITCFICDLVINKSLTWSLIVLNACLIGFSITNLPIIIKKRKIIIPALIATILTFPLIYISINDPKLFITNGLPILILSLIPAWIILIIIKYVKLNYTLKLSLIFLVSAATVFSINPGIILITNNDFRLLTYLMSSDQYMDHSAVLALLFISLILMLVGIKKR